MYRHALPPGFVFKTKKKPDEELVGAKISLEQLVEEEVRLEQYNVLCQVWASSCTVDYSCFIF